MKCTNTYSQLLFDITCRDSSRPPESTVRRWIDRINRLYARYALRRMRVHVIKREIRLKAAAA